MIAKRIREHDERGGFHEDFVAVDIPSKPRRPCYPRDRSGVACRDIKLRAIFVLRKNGFTEEEIAIATSYSSRSVRRRCGLLRMMAEESGRV